MLVLLVLFVVAGTFDGRVGQQIPHLRTVCWMGYGTVQILLAVMGGRVHSRILLPRLPVQIVGSEVRHHFFTRYYRGAGIIVRTAWQAPFFDFGSG